MSGSSATNLSAAAARRQDRLRFAVDEVLVRYRHRSDDEFQAPAARAQRQALHRRHGSTSLWESARLRVEHIRLRPGLSVAEAIRLYEQDPTVEFAEPNFLVSAKTDDPLFDLQWALRNTGQTGGRPGADIRMVEAWAQAAGGAPTVVAVLDSGTDLTHEDLVANLWTNPLEIPGDGLDNDGNGYTDDVHGIDTFTTAPGPVNPTDDHGHGTHVAGTIGAAIDNGVGIAGLAPRVQILTCKFLDRFGVGSTGHAIRCLEYVRTLRMRGVDIVATNNSWGGGSYSQLLADAIAAQGDILFVAAAGNDGLDNDRTPFYPAGYRLPNVLAVSATDHNDARPAWADYGRHSVAVSAPGDEIVSLRAAGTDLYRDGRHFVPAGDPSARYYRASGTSMATPHVSGVAALLRSHDPTLDWSGIRNLLLTGADAVPSLDSQTMTGRRLNALGSVACTDRPLLALWNMAPVFPLAPGTPVTLSVLSIDCRAPAGPVWATGSDGLLFELKDDGVAPDAAAGDGIFVATVTPAQPITYVTFTSTAGQLSAPYTTIANYLPMASVGMAYAHTLEHIGAAPPSAWVVLTGSLPPGLALNAATGVVSGTPLVAGTSSFRIRATDTLGRSASAEFVLAVSDGPLLEFVVTQQERGFTKVPHASAVDADGNTIVAGHIEDTVSGRDDFFIRKYDRAGRILWSRSRDDLAGPRSKAAYGVAVDSAGAIYVTGGAWRFGLSDFILVKYDSQGNELWATRHDDGASEVPFGIALDGAGDVIVTGMKTFSGSSAVAYTVKFGPDGAVRWTRSYALGVFARLRDVAVDRDDNVYATGEVGSVYAQQGTTTFYTYAQLTIKYDGAGNVLWTRTDTQPGQQLNTGHAIVVDRDGNSYVGGWFNGSDVIRKFDAGGGLLWSRAFFAGGGQYPQVDDLALDATGQLIVAGAYYGSSGWNYYLAKLSPDASLEWWSDVPGDYLDVALDVVVDGEGLIHVSRPWDHEILVSTYAERLRIVTRELASAVRGYAYSQRIDVKGGYGPFAWRVTTGSLPPGVALDEASGEIHGAPTDGGTFDFAVSVSGRHVPPVEARFSLTVAFIEITRPPFPWFAMVGRPFQDAFVAVGTASPFTWRIVGGALPPGLRLGNASGAVIGVPTTAGAYEFMVEVADKELHTARQAWRIGVYDALQIETLHVPNGAVGVPYEASIVASGGVPPLSWYVTRGALPEGLVLDPGTGRISGTPAARGVWHFTVTVFDGWATDQTRQLTVIIE